MASETEWASRVRSWRRSGLTAAAFCRDKDYAASTLLWYSSRLGARARSPKEPRTAMVRLGELRAREPITIELEDAVIRVPDGVDGASLRVVLQTLRELRGEEGSE